MFIGKMGLVFLVPALALSGCSTTMTAEQAMAKYGTDDPAEVRAIVNQHYNEAMRNAQVANAQMQQNLQNGFQMIQRGQAGWQDQPSYSYQRSDSVWVYCNRLTDSMVSCRPQLFP